MEKKPLERYVQGVLARLARFERATFRLGGGRSILLSYRRMGNGNYCSLKVSESQGGRKKRIYWEYYAICHYLWHIQGLMYYTMSIEI
jgi:hypothetical protein